MFSNNVGFLEIPILLPWKVIGNSEGEGVSKCKVFKGRYDAKLEFPEGWGLNQKTFHGGGIFHSAEQIINPVMPSH